MKRRYALNGLDAKIEEYIDFDNGLYFEAGANDGENQSNTCYFARERGWTGILVEPIVERYKRCRELRPESKVVWAALVPDGWKDPFVELTYCDLMTVTNSELTAVDQPTHVKTGEQFLQVGETSFTFHAPARTVSSILAEHAVTKIDLFSLDLEGFEAPVIGGLISIKFT